MGVSKQAVQQLVDQLEAQHVVRRVADPADKRARRVELTALGLADFAERNRVKRAIEAADTLMLTVPNQLGVDYNAHAIESILKFVAPELGWR